MKDYLFENFLNWFGREFGSSFYGIGITNFLLHTMSINAKAQGICEHVHWVQNFVSLILSFCSLFFVLFFFFFSFFLFSFEVQILHTWLVCSSWTPFCLFLIQMGSLCNVLSKCTNFGSFCAMIKRKKKCSLAIEKWGDSNGKFSMFIFCHPWSTYFPTIWWVSNITFCCKS